jgi:predicted oxidoreductase
MNMMILSLAVLVLALGAINALVPTVPLCDFSDCPTVSAIGLGTLHLGADNGISDPDKIHEWITAAVEEGITLFDTADVYPIMGGKSGDSAILFGQALAKTKGLREKITIVAKTGIVFPPSLEPTETCINVTGNHILTRVNWYLDALQTSYLDILMLHFPDAFMNPIEVRDAFASLKKSGKVLHFGVSNHYPSHFNALQKKLDDGKTGIRLMSNQVELSAWNPRYFNYDHEIVDHAVINGIKLMGWGALGGDPFGGANRLFRNSIISTSRQSRVWKALSEVGKELGINDNAVVALAWLLSHPTGAVIPLIGTTRVSRVKSLVKAVDYAPKFSRSTWWTIGTAGGLCALADAQCAYDGYK